MPALPLVLAFAPSLLVALALATRHPAEIRRLAAALGAGGLAGVLVVAVLPAFENTGARADDAPWLAALLTAWGHAALPEETARLIALLAVSLPGRVKRATLLRLGAATGLGYGAFENTLVALYHPTEVLTLALRATTSLPAHVLFGVVMGGLAGRGGLRAWLGAWLAAMLLHVAYDAPLFLVARTGRLDGPTSIAVVVFVIALVGGWLSARAMARRAEEADVATGTR